MSNKLAQRLTAMVVASAIGFIVFGAFAFFTLQQLKVNGPVYDRIVLGKDLIADILPPPKYIIEAYLVSMQLYDESSAAKIEQLTARFATLKKEYDDRHVFWLSADLDPKLEKAFLKPTHEPAQRFFDIADKAFFPAVASRDRNQLTAALAQMSDAYEKHRHAIDNVVTLTNQYNLRTESDARAAVSTHTWLLIGILLAALGSVMYLSNGTRRRVLQQLGADIETVVDLTHQIATGDLSGVITVGGGDSTSLLAALKDMQKNLRHMVEQLAAHASRLATAAAQLASVTDLSHHNQNSQHSQC